MNLAYQIEDGASLAASLAALPKAVARTVARSALKDAGGPVLAAVKSGIHSETGLLASGTRLRAGRGDREGRIAMLISAWAKRSVVAQKKPRLHVATGGAGKDQDRYQLYYGRFVEFGHRIGRGKNADTVVGAHPFMGPGFDASSDGAAAALEQALGDGIDQAFSEGAS